MRTGLPGLRRNGKGFKEVCFCHYNWLIITIPIMQLTNRTMVAVIEITIKEAAALALAIK